MSQSWNVGIVEWGAAEYVPVWEYWNCGIMEWRALRVRMSLFRNIEILE